MIEMKFEKYHFKNICKKNIFSNFSFSLMSLRREDFGRQVYLLCKNLYIRYYSCLLLNFVKLQPLELLQVAFQQDSFSCLHIPSRTQRFYYEKEIPFLDKNINRTFLHSPKCQRVPLN